MKDDFIKRFDSRAVPGRLMHVIVDCTAPFQERINVTPEVERLQIGVVRLSAGATVGPHAHNPLSIPPEWDAAEVVQESWIVLRGAIRARLYDVDRKLLHEGRVEAGGLVVTFRGGHALECLETGTVLIECKTGPYRGRDYTTFQEA